MTSDTKNRKRILEELNPRKTIMNEATQTRNPVTGKVYEDQFIILIDLNQIPFKNEYSNFNFFYKTNLRIVPKKDLFGLKLKETSSGLLECQKALARMNVREGKLSEFEYEPLLSDIQSIVDAFKESDFLTLRSITDAKGLDTALKKIEEKRLEKEYSYKLEEKVNEKYFYKLGEKVPKYK